MTHRALQISAQLQAAIAECIRDGRPGAVPPGPRDGLAALACWRAAGRPVERITPDDVTPIPADLRIDIAPIARAGVGYILLDRRDWLILGRVAARQPVSVAPGISYAYAEPTLVYCGWRGAQRRSVFTGHIDLGHHPAARTLSSLDPCADEDHLAVGMCLARFLGLNGSDRGSHHSGVAALLDGRRTAPPHRRAPHVHAKRCTESGQASPRLR